MEGEQHDTTNLEDELRKELRHQISMLLNTIENMKENLSPIEYEKNLKMIRNFNMLMLERIEKNERTPIIHIR
jgi:hypothetical protein